MTDKPRVLLVRAIITRRPGEPYAGVVPLFGFQYHVEARRVGDDVELSFFDGPVAPGYEVPFLDGET